MDEKTQQQIVQLVQAAMQQNPQALQQIQQIKQAADSGNQQAAALFQVIQQVAKQLAGQQTAAAAKGAKLQYISSLKNKCKEGEELIYMKAGGRVCPVCQKKKVQAEKCGGSTKKFKKMWDGGEMPSQKKKKTEVNDTIHINGQPRSLVNINGPLNKKYKPLTNKEYQTLREKAKKGDADALRKVNKQNSVQQ